MHAGFRFVPLLLALSPVGCALSNTSWLTPLAPPREAKEADCPVAYVVGNAPPGTQTLGVVRCRYYGGGPTCHELARQSACAIGGDIVYGVHWESGYRTDFLLGTIGVRPRTAASPIASR